MIKELERAGIAAVGIVKAIALRLILTASTEI